MSDKKLFNFRLLLVLMAASGLAGCKIEVTTENIGSSTKETTATDRATTGPVPVARVMTYNIQFLNQEAAEHGNRIEKLRKVVADIDPTIVAVQEVEDRQSMELVFPPTEWYVIIDDDSPDNQDLAFAVSRDWKIVGIARDLDADDENFLAEGDEHESYFPNRRDGLFVTIESLNGSASLTVINVHAKARVGGRPQSDPRREGAARVLVEAVKDKFDSRNVVIMGDFNDTPDDASLNILETGDPKARGEAETETGSFMINLTEPLWAKGMVTHGAHVKRLDRKTGLINNVYAESRDRNNRTRGREAGTGPTLLDNILVTKNLEPALVDDEATIYRKPVALDGPGFTRTSDHLPVYADIDLNKLK